MPHRRCGSSVVEHLEDDLAVVMLGSITWVGR
jgi:hypothetical protein